MACKTNEAPSWRNAAWVKGIPTKLGGLKAVFGSVTPLPLNNKYVQPKPGVALKSCCGFGELQSPPKDWYAKPPPHTTGMAEKSAFTMVREGGRAIETAGARKTSRSVVRVQRSNFRDLSSGALKPALIV